MTKARHLRAAIFLAGLMGIGMGCELIASVDRGKLDTTTGGQAGATTGGGGTGATGGTTTGGGGATGGTTGGTGGATCMPVDDNNECTDDICNAENMPESVPKAAGAACTTGGSMCDGAGNCVECLAPADCPGEDNACQTRTCDQGVCGFDFVAADTPIPTQTTGDCLLSVCDGAGAVVDSNDDADVPDDSNDCTDDVCTSGVASNPPKAADTACGVGGALVCDGAGACIGCNTPDNCAGTDDECKVRTCVNKTCGVDFTAANTPIADQTAANCLQTVCDGSGNTAQIADDADVPADDGNACTDDTCAAGAPIHPAKANGASCNDGDACSQTDTCQSGTCTGGNPVVCTAQDQCHDVGTCDSATGMCSNPTKADGASCSDGNACTQTDTCTAGVCGGANPVVCTAQDQCHDVGVCNMATGVCSNPAKADGASCSDGNSCTQTDTCQAGACTGANPVVCTASDQCHDVGTCNMATGVCSNPAKADGATCNDNDACSQTDTCQAGTCTGGNPVVCTASDQCHIAGTCNAGTGMCSNPNASNGTVCANGAVPGTCQTGVCAACGDNVVQAPEVCDDGNAVNADGCDTNCTVSACGNGIKAGAEQCDDGNVVDGDGCTATCLLGESEVNNTPAAANLLTFVANASAIYGAIPTATDADYYKVVLAQRTSIKIQTFDGSGGNTCSVGAGSHDTKAFLYAPDGTTELASNDDGGVPNCSLIDPAATAAARLLAPGTYFIKIQHYNQTATIASYRLQVTLFPCGDGTKETYEACDDNNTASGDGCSNACAIEAGYGCAGSPSVCQFLVCGNNNVEIGEPCDDGGTTPGDGCSATCTVETGYSCTGNPSVCTVVCGDGIKMGAEQCDDGNILNGDCCSSTCQLVAGCETEPNNACGASNTLTLSGNPASGSLQGTIVPIGDGDLYGFTLATRSSVRVETFIGGAGQCTAVTGSADTEIELRAADCSTILGSDDDDGPGVCSLIDPTVAADSYARALAPNTYFVRVFEHLSDALVSLYQVQVTVVSTCGNGVTEPSETCDDNNFAAGDGCSATCQIEANYTCSGSPSVCLTIACGNGVVQGAETCDDNGTTPGDGCNATCQVEAGYTCSGNPSVCLTIACGNGVVQATETCDDNNLVPGDGCDGACATEPGFTCTGNPSACTFTCGNGTVTGAETCDDGNLAPGDGCSPACLPEAGYACAGFSPNLCWPVCGNGGSPVSPETCDDGNTSNGDGCDSACATQTNLTEVDPNGTTAEADAAALLINGASTMISGAITPTGDKDIFKMTLATAGVVRFETFDTSGNDCTSANIAAAMKLSVLSSAGAVLYTDTTTGIGNCSAIVANMAAGTYYVQVEKSTSGTITAYKLEVKVQTSKGNESEANDTRATSDALPVSDTYMFGGHQAAGDFDVFAISVPAGKSIRAETIEGGAETCESFGVDSRIRLFNAAGTDLGNDSDTGRGFCSLIDGTGATPANGYAHNLAGGIYYLQVEAHTPSDTSNTNMQFDYRLVVTVR